MGLGLLGGGEDTSRLYNVVGSRVLPGDITRVLFHVEFDGLSINDQIVTIDLDLAFELTMLSIVLEHIGLL